MTPRSYLITIFLAALALGGCGNDAATDARAQSTVVTGPNSSVNPDDHSGHDHDAHEDGDDDHGDHDDDHQDHEEHEGHEDDDHDDHAHAEEGEHNDHVELSRDAAAEAGIRVSRAVRAPLQQSLSLPAELRFDADRIANVSPQISGRIIRLTATEGDTVTSGATLAILSSRELADLKAEYMTANTAEDLAGQALEREETLFSDRITSEADLQAARAALAAASANREGVENKLHAVGVSHEELERLSDAPDGTLANVRLSAPIGGVIARRTATLGATVSADDPAAPALFTIVDDRVLWADIAVYKQSTGSVQIGSTVVLKSESGRALAEGEIATILPAIDETSRTATARMIVENPEARLRPGQFVTADISVGDGESRLQVPSGA
ncbi:MAG: efflux RND transporter periplasmic adaptor subunit, partial [Pseudomonadota bacterium]